MSISLSVYEFFSYALPGILYLYVFNEFVALFNSTKLDISQLNQVEAVFLLAVAYLAVCRRSPKSGFLNHQKAKTAEFQGFFLAFSAFSAVKFRDSNAKKHFSDKLLAGHIMNTISESIWNLFNIKNLSPRRMSPYALEELAKRLPDLGINFKFNEWDILLNRIRQDGALSAHIERFKALSIMLRNTSFAIFLVMIVQLTNALTLREPRFIANAIGLCILGIFAAQRSATFDIWFYNGIFSEGLRFGNSVREMLKGGQKKSTTKHKKNSKEKTSQ